MANTKNLSEYCEHPTEMMRTMRQMMKMTTSRIHTEYEELRSRNECSYEQRREDIY